jgi:tetratricopeptide (TPR) repeat protein
MKSKKIKKNKNDQFEIQFLEGVIDKSPCFIEALIALGDLYTKNGLFEQGLAIDQKLASLRPEDPFIFYNLACSYSLLNEVNKSFSVIQLAIRLGYNDFDFLKKDRDLENLRLHPSYNNLLSQKSTRINS